MEGEAVCLSYVRTGYVGFLALGREGRGIVQRGIELSDGKDESVGMNWNGERWEGTLWGGRIKNSEALGGLGEVEGAVLSWADC